jgi:hypothetical protein
MGDWELATERSFVFGQLGLGSDLVIHVEKSKLMLVGKHFQVCFASTRQGFQFTGFLTFIEKVSESSTGALMAGRTLNADGTRTGQFAIMLHQQPDLRTFLI